MSDILKTLTLSGIVAAIATFCGAWARGAFDGLLPRPEIVLCFCRETVLDLIYKIKPPTRTKFVILISKLLADDSSRTHTRALIHTFQGREDIDRIVTCRTLQLRGAGIDAEAASIATGRRWLKHRQADLLIWGEVLQPHGALALWFLNQDSTSSFQATPFRLELNSLSADFKQAAEEELVAAALASIKPATEAGRKFLGNQMRLIANKLESLNKRALDFGATQRANIHGALGLAHLVVGRQLGERAEIVAAIDALRLALQDSVRSSDPLNWAANQHRLGNAYLELSAYEQESSSTLAHALSAYDAALEERTREKAPREWANSMSGKALVLRRLGSRTRSPAHLKLALVAFRAAADELTDNLTPFDWCGIQNNIAVALSELAEFEPTAGYLGDAAGTLRNALKYCRKEDAPRLWSILQGTFGTVLFAIGKGELNSDSLERAAEAFYLALQECTREIAPVEWGAYQLNLGNVLLALGERSNNTHRLSEAVEAYRLALEQIKKDTPIKWAMALSNLGTALTVLAKITIGPPTIKFMELSSDPTALVQGQASTMDWKVAQHEIGSAISKIHEREQAIGWLDEAIASINMALSMVSRDEFPREWAMMQNALSTALCGRGENDSNIDILERALEAADNCLREWTIERFPLQWIKAAHNKAVALLKIGERKNGSEELNQAVGQFNDILSKLREGESLVEYANAQSGLGDALLLLGGGQRSLPDLQKSIDAYKNAIEIYQELGAYRQVEWATAACDKASTLIASLE